MYKIKQGVVLSLLGLFSIALCSCATMDTGNETSQGKKHVAQYTPANYESRLPSSISSKEKTVLVDPNVHAWGAYEDGALVRGGLAAAGAGYCPDIHRPCHTKSGTFRIYSLGSADCKSHIFPVPRGGAPMPYCMYFNGGQALHGSYELADANISHGCVRLDPSDAAWLRFNFANIGTKVIVRPY